MTILGNELLMGEQVRLAKVRREDLPTYVDWFSRDIEMMRMIGQAPLYPMTFQDEEQWYEDMQKKENLFAFGIRTLDEDRIIGGCSLFKLNWQARVSEVGIVIGDASMRGKGCGTDAMRVIVRYGFMELNLNRIWLRVFSYNPRAVASYEKVGFVHEGTRREDTLRDGTYHDTLIMGILRREWEAKYR